jgi:hypothetical protein
MTLKMHFYPLWIYRLYTTFVFNKMKLWVIVKKEQL